ncbi:hypothetical protein LJ655_01180 [Paraburkholderia sp. MMS20-SJTN17]|uniref:Copper-binding protein n=1 Tax=Paraburkholderia translucens TaxID=2886945 RepID=A0ABS8K769_9BURK|nr:hypothetical protein [Paraburkholderia sp. MMS20-SJTN17]MCC8400517.1 hypothetical protein [Paraburkholderia sp. MMS20-SJTN17]
MMKRGWQSRLLTTVAALAIGAAPAYAAADGEAATKPAPDNEYSGASVAHANAVVFALDTGRNSMTLLEDNGEPVDVVVDPSVGDVGKLRLGDTVAVTFNRALLLRADKSNESGIRERVDREFTTGASLGSSLAMHRVEAVATVVQIDRDKRELTLRGLTRNVVLQASSDSLLDSLEAGDSVRVDYVEAIAVQITRDGVPLR